MMTFHRLSEKQHRVYNGNVHFCVNCCVTTKESLYTKVLGGLALMGHANFFSFASRSKVS